MFQLENIENKTQSCMEIQGVDLKVVRKKNWRKFMRNCKWSDMKNKLIIKYWYNLKKTTNDTNIIQQLIWNNNNITQYSPIVRSQKNKTTLYIKLKYLLCVLYKFLCLSQFKQSENRI